MLEPGERDKELTSPAQPSETQRVLGTAMLTLGAIGIILSLAGIPVSIGVIAFALLVGMVRTPAGTFYWPLLTPLAVSLGLGIVGWILIKIGARLRV